MTTPLPKYITRDSLLAQLQEEVATLGDSELAWWRQHSVSPFAVRNVEPVYGEMYHFVVAVCGSDIVFFFDGYNGEFACAKLEAGSDTMRDIEINGNGKLQDAITHITH